LKAFGKSYHAMHESRLETNPDSIEFNFTKDRGLYFLALNKSRITTLLSLGLWLNHCEKKSVMFCLINCY